MLINHHAKTLKRLDHDEKQRKKEARKGHEESKKA